MHLDRSRPISQTNSLLSHVGGKLAALRHVFARARRAQRDHEYLLRMTESHLRDIGLCRVKLGGNVDFVRLDDGGV